MCVSYQPSFWGPEFVTNAVVFSPRFARLAFQAGCGLKMRIASGKTMVNDNMRLKIKHGERSRGK
jgi:hypothetical protein